MIWNFILDKNALIETFFEQMIKVENLQKKNIFYRFFS